MEMKRKNKDKYKCFFIALWIMVPLFVVMDIFAFLYGEPYSFNSYPILPFNVQPSYVRGIHRLCYTIDGIFESPVCADNCETIPIWIENPQGLDSLCIYSVLQYAWKKDSLLMEVSLSDSSTRWLLASPASSKQHKCKLQEVAISDNQLPLTFHSITLQHKDPNKGHLFEAVWLLQAIFYIILLISIPILNVLCLILTIRAFSKLKIKAADAHREIICILLYVCTTIMPIIVWNILRAQTYATHQWGLI